MASITEMPLVSDPIPTKRARSKKTLKPKTSTSNESNIMAETISDPSPISVPPEEENLAGKENQESPSKAKKTKKGGSKAKKNQDVSLESALQEMQEKLEKLSLEKQKTEEMLKAKDEVLRQKEEELETKGKEQEKLQVELKKLQKLKEFKPSVSFPISQLLKENETDNKDAKKKKKKGEATRKKPTPSYALWLKDQWIEVKKTTPDADFKQVSNFLGAKWKTVTPEEKKPYEERYQAEKEAYLKIVGHEKREIEAMKLLEEDQKQKTAMELLEQYMQFVQETEKEPKKPSKKEKDPLKPKHPMSAFFEFSKEKRAALMAENKNVTEVAKLMGEEWRNMTEAQKAPYEERAMKNKEDYTEEMKLYKQKKDEEAATLKREENETNKLQKQEALQLLKKKEKTENLIKKTKENKQNKKKEVDPNKPKKPASSFFLFSKEERKRLSEERQGLNNAQLTALISLNWKELSEEDKQIWNNKAAVTMEAYKKELEEYNKTVAESSSSSNVEK